MLKDFIVFNILLYKYALCIFLLSTIRDSVFNTYFRLGHIPDQKKSDDFCLINKVIFFSVQNIIQYYMYFFT